MKTAPMAGKSRQPSHEPPVRGTGTRDTVGTVERSGGRGGRTQENCLGDELPHDEMQENASFTYATLS